MASKNEKMIEDIGKMTVIELADLVKALEETFGVSAAAVAAPVAATASGSGDAGASEEKSEYKVTLKDVGSEKIKVLKAIKGLTPNMSLGDAKKIIESVPSVVLESAPKEQAEKVKKDLEAFGATVELS